MSGLNSKDSWVEFVVEKVLKKELRGPIRFTERSHEGAVKRETVR